MSVSNTVVIRTTTQRIVLRSGIAVAIAGTGTLTSVNGDEGPDVTLAAADIPFTPNGSIAATDVQSAIQEVRDEAGSVTPAAHHASHENGGGDEVALDASQVTTGTFDDARIPAGVARDSEVVGLIAAHVDDATDAHDASAISILDTANDFTATDVEGALAELQAADEAHEAALTAHLSDASDAHDASAISILDTANDFTATDVEGALAELQSDAEADATALSDHIADSSAAHAASAIGFTPNGTIAATNVQAAIQEVRDEAGTSGVTLPITEADVTNLITDLGDKADDSTVLHNTGDEDRSGILTILDDLQLPVGDPPTARSAVPRDFLDLAQRTVTADTSVTDADDIVRVNSASAHAVTLPDATTAVEKFFTIKNINTGLVTVETVSGQTIDGAATYTLVRWAWLDVISDGANWSVL